VLGPRILTDAMRSFGLFFFYLGGLDNLKMSQHLQYQFACTIS
jgi:hypothetical protein